MSGGFRFLPHTADIRFEAWGTTREECLAQAACALIDAFAEVPATAPARTTSAEIDGGDEQLLLAVLDEIIYRLDAAGTVPRSVDVRPTPTGLALELSEVDIDRVRFTGAAPKAISLHGFSLTHDERGWRCSVTVDV
ncbi:SHS2 domain-containing protein [Saccharopolyspora antimicrobica]|uniref:SHS2 domain-containing protein n=1 Tax=Saccharopolyspora antimicrobica TaxID=455193 RepID=A0A1I4QLQ8_9PSEU|nr:archease [Saccharopolyspora antimicrobica]RKT88384.1 SHS2 domain-containing protein [Saccharopolyspora antimicrobica]SFM41008.1 SHS2 domain-containing protein [Saccharopolyspora antimicrobica]